MKFDWISKYPEGGIVTVYESNITLNRTSSMYFQEAFAVMLGIDYENKLLGIKPVSKEEYNLGLVNESLLYKISLGGSYSRISNKKFIEELKDIIEMNFKSNSSYKFNAYWNSKEKVLFVELDKEV